MTDRGYVVTSTSFLDPGEIYFAREYVNKIGACKRSFFFGGYTDAERKCVFFLPEYYESVISDIGDTETVLDTVSEINETIKALKICGSSYKNLTHRDYLGAILNMGIDRSAIGDICVLGEYECIIFALPSVADLIKVNCERIGSDKVKIEEISIQSNFEYERKTKIINDTVASDRLDCVVGAIVNESREKAKSLILSGFVECNYSVCSRTDLRIKNG
ncbi:MAG: hypothetical protein IKT56_03390, partial [Clostridia bacterium]|nr:hypothetical protein [Clostridia bacterium]